MDRARSAIMHFAKVSACGRFVVIEGLYLDRAVFERLTHWASEHEIRIQDAMQLAVCAFNEQARTAAKPSPSTVASDLHGASADR